MKRNHKDIEWKQLFFEIPFFFGPPCSYFFQTGDDQRKPNRVKFYAFINIVKLYL